MQENSLATLLCVGQQQLGAADCPPHLLVRELATDWGVGLHIGGASHLWWQWRDIFGIFVRVCCECVPTS